MKYFEDGLFLCKHTDLKQKVTPSTDYILRAFAKLKRAETGESSSVSMPTGTTKKSVKLIIRADRGWVCMGNYFFPFLACIAVVARVNTF